MKRLIIIGLMMFVAVELFAQDFEKVGMYQSQNILEKNSKNVYSKPFDILHYKLDASLAMVDSGFDGIMNIKILITNSTDSLVLNSVGLSFSSLTVNDTSATYNFYPLSETFSIHLPRVCITGETLLVKIDYKIDYSYPRIWNRMGYYWFRKSPGAPDHIEENIGYTMAEPSDARLWMPCYDDPTDKASCEINATVPVGYEAGSNGLLMSTVNNPDSTITFKWREDLPITTYLMVISASKFSKFSQFYHRVTNPMDSVEIINYMWQMDSAGTTWNAVNAFEKVPQMMEVFSTIFGEYPFAKYGHAVAYPFYYGGMEHQTLTTIHRGWLSVNAYPFYDDYIAHELSHQWWGDLVTCGTWKDIWLNEGFATYSEVLWREKYFSITFRNELLDRYTRFGDGSWRYAIYDPQGQGINLFTGNVYQKAGWVLHMLRYLVGDSLFFKILDNHRAQHSFGTATTQDFINTVNTTTGRNYDWFFNEWIYGKGWVKYASQTVWNGDSSKFTITIQQQQDLSWPIYKMPLEIKLFWTGHDSTVTVWDSLRTQSYQFILASQPDSIELDPNNKILNQIDTVFSAIDEDTYRYGFKLYQNYPNPFNPRTKIRFRILDTGAISLIVFDMLGRVAGNIIKNEVYYPGDYEISFDGQNLCSGVYYYQIKVGNNISTKKMLLIK